MPIIVIEEPYLLIAIFALCFIFQLGGALVGLFIPDSWYEKDHFIFRIRKFEHNGEFYDNVFRISKWKKYLPDAGKYKKKHLNDYSISNLQKFIIESKRAELSHLLGAIPFVTFFIITPWYAFLVLIVYDILVNAPCYMAQRYNRPRVEKLLQSIIKRKSN